MGPRLVSTWATYSSRFPSLLRKRMLSHWAAPRRRFCTPVSWSPAHPADDWHRREDRRDVSPARRSDGGDPPPPPMAERWRQQERWYPRWVTAWNPQLSARSRGQRWPWRRRRCATAAEGAQPTTHNDREPGEWSRDPQPKCHRLASVPNIDQRGWDNSRRCNGSQLRFTPCVPET